MAQAHTLMYSKRKKLELSPFFSKSQPNNFLMSRYVWLKLSLLPSTALYVVMIGSSTQTLQFFYSLILCCIIYYMYVDRTQSLVPVCDASVTSIINSDSLLSFMSSMKSIFKLKLNNQK